MTLTEDFVETIKTTSPHLTSYLIKPIKENDFILKIPSARKGFELNVWCGDCIAIGFTTGWHIHPKSENILGQIQETIQLINDIINNRRKLVFNSKYPTEIYFEDFADIHYTPDEEDEKIVCFL